MSETISPNVKRANEILDGGNSWNLADLENLEKTLAAEGQSQLASGIQSLLKKRSDVDEKAKRILDDPDTPCASRELEQLEKELAEVGSKDWARKIKRLRLQKKADEILDGPGGEASKEKLRELLELAGQLVGFKDFSKARQIMKRAREGMLRDSDPDIYEEVYQKSALYTYKDPDLPLNWKLDHAFKLLQKGLAVGQTDSEETLGLAGAIFKRKWEADRRRENLELSIFYYLRRYRACVQEAQIDPEKVKSRLPTIADQVEFANAYKKALAKAVEDARADVFTFLRENPDCKLQVDKDRPAYCGINAAFMLDLLARENEAEAKQAGLDSIAADARREAARLIREEITRALPPLAEEKKEDWWFYATVGEAYFGLGIHDPKNYDKAVEWLVEKPKDAGLTVNEWEYESTARQLASLARAQYGPSVTEEQFEETPAGKVLAIFLKDEKAVLSAFRGKFGLGLSGGGFRASLFHIGTLARLAELDVLRHVEVLSCVSGGSIIGAHYYLELRKLLQEKADDKITREDYVEIVKRVAADFLAGVQRNIRTRVAAEWVTNLKMIFLSGYSRTLRVGELYERELFSRVEDVPERDADGNVKVDKDGNTLFRSPVTGPKWIPDWLARRWWKREERLLNELKIFPLEDGRRRTDYNPRNHNWRRIHKVPDLILNAATLNTGHNWQFTASFMGEPPSPINADIDSNYRLRRMWYADAPGKYKKMRLGYAVAASSCVPGLFEPLIFDGLYPDDPKDKLKEKEKISVRLVDGGAVDNQGIASLLEQDCTVMLVSDASGQMEEQNIPGDGLFGGTVGVLLRTTSIFQARVREAQYTDIASRRDTSQLRGMMFIHLRQDLPGKNVAWNKCPSVLRKSDFESEQDGESDRTGFGISREVQRKLAAVRTDLDSFSEAEAYALMLSAYKMTGQQLVEKRCVEGIALPEQTEDWPFLKLEALMQPETGQTPGESRKRLEKILDASGSLAFKIWKLSPSLVFLKRAFLVVLAAAFLGLCWLFYKKWEDPFTPLAYLKAAYEWVRHYLAFLPAPPRLTFKLIGKAVISAAVVALGAVVLNVIAGKKYGKNIMRVIRWRDTLRNIAVGVGMSTLGFIAARIHLHIFDRLYLKYGRLDKFPK